MIINKKESERVKNEIKIMKNRREDVIEFDEKQSRGRKRGRERKREREECRESGERQERERQQRCSMKNYCFDVSVIHFNQE